MLYYEFPSSHPADHDRALSAAHCEEVCEDFSDYHISFYIDFHITLCGYNGNITPTKPIPQIF